MAVEKTSLQDYIYVMMNLNEIYAENERKLHRKLSLMDCPEPGTPEARAEIKARLCKVLGIKPEWIPRIKINPLAHKQYGGYKVVPLSFESWKNFYGMATLYLPNKARGAMLLIPGHNEFSKFGCDYQRMAQILANNGVAVLIPDVIGSGERSALGHYSALGPFACGTTVAGLIALESAGWLRYLGETLVGKPVGCLGNSGGGQAVTLLCGLFPELISVAVASGFPGTFEFTARKERRLCGCFLIPGIVGEVEMYHCLGCMCPKPVMIASGSGDAIFPPDVVRALGKRLGRLYEDKPLFRLAMTAGEHGWSEDMDRYREISNFIFTHCGVQQRNLERLPEPFFPESHQTWKLPAEAIDIDQLAANLTGKPLTGKQNLWEIFPPAVLPENISDDEKYLLAQYEQFITGWPE